MAILWMVIAVFLAPVIVHAGAGELLLNGSSMRFSALDGSATDLDGAADGTLTLDSLELGGRAEIVVDRPAAVFVVANEVQLFGRSAIRPAGSLPAEGPQIEIRAGSIRLFGRASLRADGRTQGGVLRLCATGNIEIRDQARISAKALDGAGPGGTVHLETGRRLLLDNRAVLVSASGGRGGSVTLVSCGKDGSRPGSPPAEAAILIRGYVEAFGTSGSGGSVKVEARQGGVDFQPARQGPPMVIDAKGTTRPGRVSIRAATSVVPGKLFAQPEASVVTGSPVTAACGCSSGTADGPVVVAIDVDRTTGVPGTAFALSGRVVESASPVEQWRWRLTDGRELTGRTISISFPAPGLYGAEVTATDRNGNVARAETGLQVFDPATQAPPELGLPPVVGDVDGDGLVTLEDAHRTAKHAGRLESLPAAAELAADIDLDGQVTPGDALLIGQAVAAGQPLPSVISPVHGAPGARVNLISPELLDPAALIEIEVGESTQVQRPLRPARGYATFMIPLDATRRGSLDVTPGPVEVRIRRDGTVVQTFTFQVEEPPPLPADPKAELKALLADRVALLQMNQEAIRILLDLSAVEGEDRELLLASFTVAQQNAAAAVAELSALLDEPGGDELARLFFLFANADGYPEYRQSVDELLGGDPAALRAKLDAIASAGSASVDEILDLLCLVKSLSDGLDTGGVILGWGCDALLLAAIGAILVPADGPVVDVAFFSAWATRCAAVEVAAELPLLINSLVTSMDADLRFTAMPASPRSGEMVKLRAEIELIGLDDLCSFPVGQGRDKLIENLARKAARQYLRRKLRPVLRLIPDNVLEKLAKELGDALARTVGHTQIITALETLTGKACDYFNRGVPIPDDLSRILQGPNPNVGTLSYPGDGTADYLCPDSGMAGDVVFTATRRICGEDDKKEVTVACSTREVTITIGDNGPANDDIFEVRVAGNTVLTSSQPVRSISTTVDLPAGDHQVQMIGRAAPDGVGTYFIEFSGATVVGGDPLSGSDLTPGVVKTFLIRVQ